MQRRIQKINSVMLLRKLNEVHIKLVLSIEHLDMDLYSLISEYTVPMKQKYSSQGYPIFFNNLPYNIVDESFLKDEGYVYV